MLEFPTEYNSNENKPSFSQSIVKDFPVDKRLSNGAFSFSVPAGTWRVLNNGTSSHCNAAWNRFSGKSDRIRADAEKASQSKPYSVSFSVSRIQQWQTDTKQRKPTREWGLKPGPSITLQTASSQYLFKNHSEINIRLNPDQGCRSCRYWTLTRIMCST